jgi:hypothetical protein
VVEDPNLFVFSIVVTGVEFATWAFAFETRKTFRGGIFWNAWRLIGSSLIFLMFQQVVVAYEAAYGSSFAADAVRESFESICTILLLLGFYRFYRAWNPQGVGGSG